MSVPRTPAELRELALQLAVDLARNGRIATGNSSTTELPAAIVTAAETFTTFLQGPAPDPDPFLALCTCGHARVGHRGGMHDCGRCSCPVFNPAFVLSESGALTSASTGATITLTNDRPDPALISSGRTLPTGHLIGSVGAGNIAGCDYCGASVINNGRITLAGARACPVPGKSDDSRAESVQEYVAFLKTHPHPDPESARAHAWGDADPVTGVVRCKDCLGRLAGIGTDHNVSALPCSGVLTCPACRHEAHADVCFNFASDNDCACTFDSRTIGFASAAPVAVHASHDVRTGKGEGIRWCHTCGLTLFTLGKVTATGWLPCPGGYSDDQDGSPS